MEELFNDNILIYERDGKLREFILPDLHLGLEIFRVPEGHPCHPGQGLRTNIFIPSGTIIGHYAGIYRHIHLADTTPYSFEVNKNFIVDALRRGNKTRYINDPRNTKNKANVAAMKVNFKKENLSAVAIYTITDIESGSEIYMNYGGKYSMDMYIQPWENDPIDVDLIPVKIEKDETNYGNKKLKTILEVIRQEKSNVEYALKEEARRFLQACMFDYKALPEMEISRNDVFMGKLPYASCTWGELNHIYDSWTEKQSDISIEQLRQGILLLGGQREDKIAFNIGDDVYVRIVGQEHQDYQKLHADSFTENSMVVGIIKDITEDNYESIENVYINEVRSEIKIRRKLYQIQVKETNMYIHVRDSQLFHIREFPRPYEWAEGKSDVYSCLYVNDRNKSNVYSSVKLISQTFSGDWNVLIKAQKRGNKQLEEELEEVSQSTLLTIRLTSESTYMTSSWNWAANIYVGRIKPKFRDEFWAQKSNILKLLETD